MTNEYLYGAYGHLSDTVAQSAVKGGTVPVYVGTAPVNLIRGHSEKSIINEPVMINNLTEAQRRLGYSSDWNTFTLCEPITAHFDNPIGNIGPAFLINVLDPTRHKKAEPVTRSLTFSTGRAEIVSDTIILDSLVLADKMENVDFLISYNFGRKTTVITSMNPDDPLTGNISATYEEIDPGAVTAEDIIGGVTSDGEYSGLGCLALLYPQMYAIPNLIAAPGWSHLPSVYDAMIRAGSKINGHWDAFILADLPLIDKEGNPVDTIEKALSWKRLNGYNNERSKVFWPEGQDNSGRIFHYSTLAAVEFMRVDDTHNSIPMETCGNKPVSIMRHYFGAESPNRGFDQENAKVLTSNGISTAVSWAGRFVLWGDHTAAFAFGSDTDPRAIFDVSIRMLMHITNGFQIEWSTAIDQPMDRNLKDRIINREQEKLDGYVSVGALIGNPKILFLESENSTEDSMNGDFRWDLPVTPTPPMKSASIYVSYSESGFAAYFEGSE